MSRNHPRNDRRAAEQRIVNASMALWSSKGKRSASLGTMPTVSPEDANVYGRIGEWIATTQELVDEIETGQQWRENPEKVLQGLFRLTTYLAGQIAAKFHLDAAPLTTVYDRIAAWLREGTRGNPDSVWRHFDQAVLVLHQVERIIEATAVPEDSQTARSPKRKPAVPEEPAPPEPEENHQTPQKADSTTDRNTKPPKKTELARALIELEHKIRREKPKGKKIVDIARDFCDDDESEVQRLLRSRRRYIGWLTAN